MGETEPVMRVEHLPVATVATIVCREIVADDDIKRLGDSLIAILQDGQTKNLILDFTDVCYISSSTLGLLVRLRNSIRIRQGQLKVCCIDKKTKSAPNDKYVYEILKISRLDQIFDICANVNDALKQLASQPRSPV